MAAKRDVVQISSYSRRLKDNIKSILDNYGEILKAAKVVTQSDSKNNEYESNVYHVENEIEIRAAKMVRAAESLSHLVAELKEYLILNDFSTINESLSQRAQELEDNQRFLSQEIQAMFEAYRENQLKLINNS